jgi:hypothetical protein
VLVLPDDLAVDVFAIDHNCIELHKGVLLVLGRHQHCPVSSELLDQADVDVRHFGVVVVSVELEAVTDGGDEEVFGKDGG